MASSMKMTVFWVVAPCSLVEVYQRFRGISCFHHQGWNAETSVNSSTRLQGATSQKTAIFTLNLYSVSKRENEFHTHTKQQIKLQFWITVCWILTICSSMMQILKSLYFSRSAKRCRLDLIYRQNATILCDTAKGTCEVWRETLCKDKWTK
jgi:hypothetical protein